MPRPKLAPVQTLEYRYIDGAKLMDLLARLFPPKTYAAQVSSHSLEEQGILSGSVD